MTPPIIDFRLTCPIPQGLDRYLKPQGHAAASAEHYGNRVEGESSARSVRTPDEAGAVTKLIDLADDRMRAAKRERTASRPLRKTA